MILLTRTPPISPLSTAYIAVAESLVIRRPRRERERGIEKRKDGKGTYLAIPYRPKWIINEVIFQFYCILEIIHLNTPQKNCCRSFTILKKTAFPK